MARKMQKARHLYDEEAKVVPGYRAKMYAMFEKYDGWYGYVDLEVGKIMSSAGRPIPAVSRLATWLRSETEGMNGGRLIFEIMIRDTPFHILNGILNRRKEQAAGAYLMVHDFVPTAELDAPFHVRYKKAHAMVALIDSPRVQLAPILGQSADKMAWRGMTELVWDKGGEGVILKDMYAPYEFGRRIASLMKIKEELTLDLKVVSVHEGAGKYAGMVGTLGVVGQRGRVHNVSGMSDEQRMWWWANPDTIIGNIVEVKAMKLLKDGSLREPRFKHIRHDKAAGDLDDV
jgi:ATP-dependent DNA ligase